MKVLVVDDCPAMRKVLGRLLCQALGLAPGPWLVEAADGLEALTKLDGVGLIVTDFQMPEMSGLELARRVRAAYPGLPIVMVSGSCEKDGAALALQAGVDYYLTKPVLPEVFAGLMAALWGQAQAA